MTKSPQMQTLLEVMSMDIFGRSRTKALEAAICVSCGGKADQFVDALSAKEYTISGLCQECQNSVFG